MAESRTKKSARNVFWGFVYQGVTLILSFVSRSIFINTLGMEYLGLNGIFTDVLTLLSMADLGFGTAMAYSFYKPLADGNQKMIQALISFYNKLYNIVAMVVLVLGIGCIPFLPYMVKTEQVVDHLVLYYMFALVNVVVSYLFVYKTTLMTADQKDYKLVSIRMWMSIIKTVLQIVSLIFWRNYIVFLSINLIFNFIGNLVATWMTEKEYPFIRRKYRKNDEVLDAEFKKSIFENMKSMFIYRFSTTVFSATDNILISMLVGTAMAGIYSNYLMLSNKLLLVEQLIFSALTASVGNVIAKESVEKKHSIFEALQSSSFIFCGIITVGYAVVVNDLVQVWIGDKYLMNTLTILAVTLNTYLACVLTPLWTYRQATGLYMKTKYIMAIGAVINIVLSVVLGKMIGLPGIIFASAIARLATYFWYEPRVLFRDYFECSANSYYIAIAKHVLLIIISMVGIGYLASFFDVTGWGSLFIEVIIVGLASSLIFFGVYHKSEGFQIILNKVQKILHKS